MLLKFRGSSQYVVYELDRTNKIAKIATSKTNYDFKEIKWRMLFDKGRETIQEKITDKLSDELFKRTIILSMLKQGYTEVKDDSTTTNS